MGNVNNNRLSKSQRNSIKSARKAVNGSRTVETVKYLGQVKNQRILVANR